MDKFWSEKLTWAFGMMPSLGQSAVGPCCMCPNIEWLTKRKQSVYRLNFKSYGWKKWLVITVYGLTK